VKAAVNVAPDFKSLNLYKMKSLIAILLYTGVFMGMFLLLSLIGFMWGSTYTEVLADHSWFFVYAIFIGWWVSLIPLREYIGKHQDYFNEYF
jgi:hypothetical protein